MFHIRDLEKTDGKLESTAYGIQLQIAYTQKFSDVNASFLERIVMFGKYWLDRMEKMKEMD